MVSLRWRASNPRNLPPREGRCRIAVTGDQFWSAYLAGDASLVLKTSGAREGQGIDTATTPPHYRSMT